MSSKASSSPGTPDARGRRRTATAIRDAMRELSVQLSLLNHHVGSRLEMRDVDLDCLDLVARHGPLSPSALARRAGLHPATVTGIVDRLERAGWVSRDRDPEDRRAVVIRAARERGAEIFALYAGMNGAIEEILGSYSDAELTVLADFLRRVCDAGHTASEELAAG
jgi:DNA-binding MarR family transcriptional regulator